MLLMVVRRVAAVLSAGLLSLGALSACSDDEPDDPTAEPSSPSSSPSPSPEEPEEPERPAAMDQANKAGAKAFVKYYWDVVDYAQVTGDLSTLGTLSFASCEWCEGGMKGIKDLTSRAERVVGGQFTIHLIQVTALKSGDVYPFQVTYRIDNAKQTVFFKDGTEKVYRPSSSKYMSTVRRDDEGHWRVGLIEELE